MENIKSGYKAKNFNRFITELESKEEFNCGVHATNGSCSCDGIVAYCPKLTSCSNFAS